MTNPNLGNTGMRNRTKVLANPNGVAPMPLSSDKAPTDALKTSIAFPPAVPGTTTKLVHKPVSPVADAPKPVESEKMQKLEERLAVVEKQLRSLTRFGALKGMLIILTLLIAVTWIYWLPLIRDTMGISNSRPRNPPTTDVRTPPPEDVFTLKVGEIKRWPFEFAPPPGSYKVRGYIENKETFSITKKGDVWQGSCPDAFQPSDVKLKYSGGSTQESSLRMQAKKEDGQ